LHGMGVAMSLPWLEAMGPLAVASHSKIVTSR
jgi:hypothetical protein